MSAVAVRHNTDSKFYNKIFSSFENYRKC